MKRNANVRLLVLKFSLKSKFLLLFFRLSQRLSLSLWKKRSKSLLSLSFLSWEWKFLTRNKISQHFDNFVKVSLICVKIRRFRLFNSSIISAISFVKRYDFVNTVTIIINRFNVWMFVFFRLSVKNKKRNSAFDLVKFSISESFNVVFFSTFSDVVFFSTLFNVVFFRFFLMSSFLRLSLMLCLLLRFFWMSCFLRFVFSFRF